MSFNDVRGLTIFRVRPLLGDLLVGIEMRCSLAILLVMWLLFQAHLRGPSESGHACWMYTGPGPCTNYACDDEALQVKSSLVKFANAANEGDVLTRIVKRRF